MAVVGTLSVVRAQLAPASHFAPAFVYLARALAPGSAEHARILAVPAGETLRVELGGGAFALEQAYRSKPRAEGRFESHRAYVDLQAMVAGEELMELADVARLAVQEDFTAERDVLFYCDYAATSVLRVAAGEVAVFFPADGHMPSLAAGAPALVRKTVVKVPVPA